MKFSTKILTLALIFISAFSFEVNAQKTAHCGTMEYFEHRLKTDPSFKADWEAKNKDLNAYMAQHPQPAFRALNPSSPLIIPVVVHIVLPDPNIITDENVEYVINTLNTDFSGFNVDSGNAGSFIGNRGHCAFKFVLARRTPAGLATNGIERKANATTSFSSASQAALKNASTGLAPWDMTKYYNIFVGVESSGSILGVSPAIGPGRPSGASADGVSINYKMFSSNPCYSDANYNLARTAVHEIGHNLGLYHTFQGGCASADFTTQLSSVGAALPASMLNVSNDDTPPTAQPQYGCPAVGTQTACTPATEMQFQNYMDYANDACMTMFTINQVKRMEYVIEFLRSGWLTTQGHLPPVGTPNNEAGVLDMINPGGTEYVQATCSTISYSTPTCGNPVFSPRVKIQNFGVDTLKTVTISVANNGVFQKSKIINLSLNPGKGMYVDAPDVALAVGNNKLQVYTSLPNGTADIINGNDTLSKVVVLAAAPAVSATTLPTTEGFEDAAFAPTINGWKVVNPQAASNTWTRVTNAKKTGVASAYIKMFGYAGIGDLDYLKSSKMNIGATPDSVILSFDYAYRLKGTNPTFLKDTLSIEISNDCDELYWKSIWKKGGMSLRTSTTVTGSNWNALAADWTTTPIRVSLNDFKDKPFVVAFKTQNGNGQNLFLDNINIFTTPVLPIKLAYFTAIQNTNNVTCKWETTLEENVNNFNVERSIDGKLFESIGTIKASNNTTNSAFYSFIDESAYNQKTSTIYYRLKTNDNNGKVSYSSIVSIKIGQKQEVRLFPNPTKDLVNIQITNTALNTTTSDVSIVDYLGRVVVSKKVSVALGTQNIELNVASLVAGNYVVVVKTNDEVKTLKLVKE